MKAPKNKGDSFGPFLKSFVQKKRTPEQGKDAKESTSPVQLLAILTKGKMTVSDLRKTTGLRITQIATTLKSLEDAKLIHFVEAGDDEFVELTPQGAKLAELG